MKWELGFKLFIIFIFLRGKWIGSVALGITNTKWAGDRDLGKIYRLEMRFIPAPPSSLPIWTLNFAYVADIGTFHSQCKKKAIRIQHTLSDIEPAYTDVVATAKKSVTKTNP